MRYQWRLLLRRSYHRSHLAYPSQVTSISTRSYSSLLHLRSGVGALQQSEEHLFQSPIMTSIGLVKSMNRSFSSEPAIEEKPSPEGIIVDVFSRLTGEDEIRKELESIDIVISQDLALKVLRRLESNPDVAVRFFRWITEGSHEEPSSKTYNMMLRVLGGNGLVNEFWDLVDVMKKKGHGLSANVRDKVGEKFQKDGLESDLVKLKKLFSTESDNSVDKICNKVRKIVMKQEWSDNVEKQIMDLKVEFQSDLVKKIVESLDNEPRKALLFFRWIDESGFYKHDEQTYNAMARVLGKENFLDRFQKIIEEMRTAGYQVEMETYVEVSTRFCQSKLLKEAVDLFEFAMAGSNIPTPHSCCLLLKKIVTAKKLDMDLFSRAVKAYTKKGKKVLTDSMLKSVLKSLRSVDRDSQINEVLEAMKECKYIPSSDLQSLIVSGLSRKGKEDEAYELINFMKTSENNLDDKAMVSLIEGYCKAGKLEEASENFKKMAETVEISYVEYAFEKLILAYCDKNRQRDAYKLLITHNKVKPRHSTYKILVKNLLKKKAVRDGGFEEALNLLPLMKDHGFPPFIDPFMIYFSKSGTSNEAFGFLKAMTSKNFPSITVVVRLFLTMLDSGRHSEAQDLLSLCPNYIRNHADVLEFFNSMKPADKSGVETQPLADSA